MSYSPRIFFLERFALEVTQRASEPKRKEAKEKLQELAADWTHGLFKVSVSL